MAPCFGPARSPRPPAPAVTATGPARCTLVAVEGGESYHRAGCNLAAGKQVGELTAAQAKRRQASAPAPSASPTGNRPRPRYH